MATDDEIKKKAKMNKEIQSNVPLKSPQEFMEKLWYALDHFNWGDSALDASSIKFLNESQIFFEQALRLKESAARVDERKHITISPIEWELEIRQAERQRCIDKLKEEVVSWTELAEAEREKPTGIMHDHLEWYVGRIHYTEGLIANPPIRRL